MNKNLNKFVHSYFDIILLILKDDTSSQKFQENIKRLFFGLLDSRALKMGLVSFGTIYKIYPKRLYYIEKEDQMKVKLEEIMGHENFLFFSQNTESAIDFMTSCYTLRIKESFKEISSINKKSYRDLMTPIFDEISEIYEVNNDFSSHDLLLALVMIASYSDKFEIKIYTDGFEMDRNKFVKCYLDKKIASISALPISKK